MFSFRPGLSLIAINFAVYIVLTIVIIVLMVGTSAASAAVGGSAAAGIMFAGIALMLLSGVAIYFVVPNELMPPLCRWSARSKAKKYSQAAAANSAPMMGNATAATPTNAWPAAGQPLSTGMGA